jgi:signal transduction histidine kinase
VAVRSDISPLALAPGDAGDQPRRITDRARHIVGLTIALGLLLTLLLNSVESLEPSYQNRSLHAAKETAAALVLLLVAALLIGRFRRAGRLLDLLALAGVLVLAVKNLVFSVLTAILTETSGDLTTWRTTGAGMLGAALLAASALAPERILRDRRRAMALTAGGCLAALGVLLILADLFELPGAFTEEPETLTELHRLSQNAELLIADAGAAVLFLIAGVFFARRAEKEVDEFQLWLGVGSIIAGIAYLNYALFPSSYTDFLYVGDIFRITAVVAWGTGTVRVIATSQAAEARAAVLEERRRVAREIHDGVAQELAFISTHMHGLAQRVNDEDETTSQIMESVQRALDETRGAISALSRPVMEPLHIALARTAHDIALRLGVQLELDIDRRVTVPPAWEDALPRILREAMANAVRHGGARTISVHLRDADGIWLRIGDDGDGFDPEGPRSAASYGLTGMRERTESLGGEFKLTSAPGAGTTIDVLLPAHHARR